jgi:hypothetical protein
VKAVEIKRTALDVARGIYSDLAGRAIEFAATQILAPLFPDRWRVIPRKEDGKPMLRQFRLWGSGSMGAMVFGSAAYLQSFIAPERLDDFHRHRWTHMRSFVLSGMLIEERYPGGMMTVRHAPDTYAMDWTTIHRLDYASPRTWTLFLMRGNSVRWGYYRRPEPAPRMVPAEEAIPIERRVRAL